MCVCVCVRVCGAVDGAVSELRSRLHMREMFRPAARVSTRPWRDRTENPPRPADSTGATHAIAVANPEDRAAGRRRSRGCTPNRVQGAETHSWEIWGVAKPPCSRSWSISAFCVMVKTFS